MWPTESAISMPASSVTESAGRLPTACETEQCFALPQPDHSEHRDRARHPSGLAKILRLSEQEALTPFFETTAAGDVDKRLRGARSM